MNLTKNQRLLGVFGILGGLTLFIGDMLFYYHPEHVDLTENLSQISDWRVKMSGITALFAAWFYLLGVGQVYYAFKNSKSIVRNIVVLTFGGIVIAYGIVHAAYLAIAISAKLSVQHNLDLASTTSLAIESNQILRLFVYPLFAVLSFFFIREVWKKKTLYPRWILLFYPLVPFLFQGIVNKVLSGKLWVVVMGGYLNLILLVFFTASTVALWNYKENTEALKDSL